MRNVSYDNQITSPVHSDNPSRRYALGFFHRDKPFLAFYRVILASFVTENMGLGQNKQIVDTLPKTSILSLNPLSSKL